MTSINPNDSFFSIQRKIEEDRKGSKTPKTPPQSDKDFKSLVQEKNKQKPPPNSQMEEEFSVVEEEYESYSASQNQGYRPVKLTAEQARLINSLNISSENEEMDETQKIQEESLFNTDQLKRNKIKNELKRTDALDSAKSSSSKSISETESITVDLSPEEIKHLQSLILKNSPKDQDPATKNLLGELDEVLQNNSQNTRQPQTMKKTDVNGDPSASQSVDANKKLRETQTGSDLSLKSSSKPETPPSPMQASMETNKSGPIKKQKPVEQKNISASEETIQPELPADKNLKMTSTINQTLPPSEKSVTEPRTQTPSQLSDKPDKNSLPLTPLSDSLVNKDKKIIEVPSVEKGKTTGGGTISELQGKGKPVESRASQEAMTHPTTPPKGDRPALETPAKEQSSLNIPAQETGPLKPSIEGATKDSSVQEVVNKNVKNLENLLDPSKAQPMLENRSIENSLNERFGGKKEIIPGVTEEARANTSIKSDLKQEAASSAKQAEISSTQVKPLQGGQLQEIKSSRKTKESEARSIEAETTSASSVAPVLQGIEGSVQLQPDRQEVSKESLTQLIKELVDQILVIRTQGQTDTVVTLRSPKVLEGATIKISTYDQARGEINITFGNLTPEAKKLLDSNLARESLSDNLKERSDIIVHNIVTTTQAETPYILPEKQVRDEREKEGRQSGGQQENDETNE